MPLGAYRINSLAKVQAVAEPEVNPRTTGFVNLTNSGDVQLSNAQYKFNTGTRGGSIVFDGTGDFLTTDLTPSFETTDFTVELFYRPISRQGSFPTIISHLPNTGAEAGVWALYDRHNAYSTKFVFYYRTNANAWATPLVSTTTVSNDTWYHIAIVRQGTTIKMYVDGTEEDSGTIDATWTNPNDVIRIGTEQTNYTNAYMDEVRISDSARYTSGFTPTTSAFTPDENTLLLLHGDGPYGSNGNFHIVDDIGDLRPLDIHIEQNITENSGSPASISTAQSKFGGSSLRMNDNNSHCEFASPEWGDAFTIEFWFRADNTSGDQFMAGVWGGTPHGGFNWTIYLNGSTVKAYVWNGSYQLNNATIGSISANTWYHVAVTWDGSTYRTFLNGTMGGTSSSSTPPAFDKWQITWVGTVGGTTSTFAGYIDEFRQSDTARYTSSFTAPTSAFGEDANTQVLLHFDGTNGATTTVDGQQADLPAIDPNNSYYLDGTVSSNTTDSEDVTVSCWFKHTSGTDLNPIMSASYNHPTDFFIIEYQGGRFRITFSNDGATPRGGDYQFGTYSASYGSGTYDDGAWHHVMLSRDSSTSTVVSYVDGVSTTAGYINQDFSKKGWPANNFTDISFLTHLAIGDSRIAGTGFQFAQLFVDNVFYDLTDPSIRAKFYNKGSMNMGTDGTASGLDQPLIFHQGDTSTFATKGGDQTAFPYTVSQSGTGANISSANGPQGV